MFKESIYNMYCKSKDLDKWIVYNTYSKSLSISSAAVIESMKEDPQALSPDVLNTMIKNGFLVDSRLDEFSKLRHIELKNLLDGNSDTMSIVLAPSLKCNFDCRYCFETNKQNASSMNSDKADDFIRFLERIVSKRGTLKKLHLTWFGGEPTLQLDIIQSISEKILSLANTLGFVYDAHMITNGYLLSLDNLILLKHYGVSSLQITLDGNVNSYCYNKRVSEDVYYKVLKNIKEANKMFSVTIRINAVKGDYEEYYSLIDYLLDHEIIDNKTFVDIVDVVDYSPCATVNRAKSWINKTGFFQTYVDKYRKKFKYINPLDRKTNSCGLIKLSNYVIDFEGNIYECEHHIGHKSNIVGDIYNGYYYNSILEKYTCLISNDRCDTCPAYPLCRGGCSSWNNDYKFDCGQEEYLRYISEVIINTYNDSLLHCE